MNKNTLAILAGVAFGALLTAAVVYGGVAQASPDYTKEDRWGSYAGSCKSHAMANGSDWYVPEKCDGDAEGTITVIGSAADTTETESLVVKLGVSIIKPTAAESLDENSRLMSAVADRVLSLGIPEDDISTSSISISPKYDYRYDLTGNEERVFLGYETANYVVVDTDYLNMTAQIIDGAVDAGATNVDSVGFAVSSETKAEIRAGLIGDAVIDAQEKAELALEPLGYEIVGVDAVLVDMPSTTSPQFRGLAEYGAADAFLAPPIFRPDQTLSVSVVVTFLISPE